MSNTCSLDQHILFLKPGCKACESIKLQVNRCNRCHSVRKVNIESMRPEDKDLFYRYCTKRVVPFMIYTREGRVYTSYGESIMNKLR